MPDPDIANSSSLRTATARPADEAARQWRAGLPDELRERSLVRGGLLLAVAAVGYFGCMVGAAWLPTFFGRTVALGVAPFKGIGVRRESGNRGIGESGSVCKKQKNEVIQI